MYEELEYWKIDKWADWFNKLNRFGGNQNYILKIRSTIKTEIINNKINGDQLMQEYKEYFLPEVIQEEESNRKVTPWFVEFFGIKFIADGQEITYSRFIDEIRNGTGDRVFVAETSEPRYFIELAEKVDKISTIAKEKKINIFTEENNSLNLKEEKALNVRTKCIESFESFINFLYPNTNSLSFFLWTLVNGVKYEYAKKYYSHLDEILEFLDINIDTGSFRCLRVKEGGIASLFKEIMKASFGDYYYLERVCKSLRVLNPPDLKEYYKKVYEELKGKDEKLSQYVKVLMKNPHITRSGNITNYVYISELENKMIPVDINLISPLLFYGVLDFNGREIGGFDNWSWEQWKNF